MSLSTTITDAIEQAFLAAGDLVKVATFTRESANGYDFVAQELNSTYEEISVDVLLTNQSTGENSTVITEFLTKATSVDLSKYSTLIVNSTTYDIDSVTEEFGVVTISARSR